MPKRDQLVKEETGVANGKKQKLNNSDCYRSLVFCPGDDNPNAVQEVAAVFGLTKELSELAVKLAKSLKVDDPGMFVTFRNGSTVRRYLQSNADGRPCDPGRNGTEALQNLRDWVAEQVPANKRQFILHCGECGMGMGNLTQDEFNQLQLALSFTTIIPPSPWVANMLTAGHSIGGVLSVTGTGVGQATMSKSPSIIFHD